MTEPAVPFEALLAHRAWVRALARRLVTDDATADDIEQETWMAAFTAPPRHGTSVRGWLATVLRRRAATRARTDGRRIAREALVARPDLASSAADLAARAETEQRVVAAVLDLPQPYRDVILLRFYEGLPPREVARRQGVPVETARTHIWRAVARLRDALGTDGRRASDDPGLVAIALLPAPSVARGGLTKGLLMGSAQKVAVVAGTVLVVAAIVGGGLLLTRDTLGPPASADAVGAAPTTATHGRLTPPAGTTAGAESSTIDPDLLPDVPPTAAAILAATFRTPEGRPAAGVDVVVSRGVSLRVRATTGAAGRLTLTGLPPGPDVRLDATADGAAPIRLRGLRLPHGDVLDLGTLLVAPAVGLDVVVTDTAGDPIAEADVEVIRDGAADSVPWDRRSAEGRAAATFAAGASEPVAKGTTDTAGHVRIDGLAAGRHRVAAAAAGRARVVSRGTDLLPGRAAQLRLVLPEAHALAGRVAHDDGTPAEGAAVVLRGSDCWDYSRDEIIVAHDVWDALTDDEGRFRIAQVPRGQYVLSVATGTGCVYDAGVVDVPTTDDRVVVLPRALASIRGVVRGDDGEPIGGAEITFSAHTDAHDTFLDEIASVRRRVVSAPDGSYELHDLPAAEGIEVTVDARGWLPLRIRDGQGFPPLDSRRTGRIDHDIVLVRGLAATLNVRDTDGRPLEGTQVALAGVGPDLVGAIRPRGVTDRDGSVTIGGLRPGTYLVVVRHEWYVQKDLPPDAEELLEFRSALPPTLLVEAGAEPPLVITLARAGIIRGRVVSSAGDPRPGVLVRPAARRANAVVSRDDGGFELRGVHPGFRVVLETEGVAGTVHAAAPLAIAAGETVDGLEIVVPDARTVSGRVRSTAGGALTDATIRIVQGSVWSYDTHSPGYYNFRAFDDLPVAARHAVRTDGSFQVTGLPAGVVTVVGEARGHVVGWTTDVDLGTGDRRDVVVTLEPTRTVSGTVRTPAGRPVSGARVEALCRGCRDAFNLATPSAVTDATGRFEVSGLRDAPYLLYVRSPETAPLLVPDVLPAGQVVSLVAEPGRTIRGHVRDETGRGVAGAQVRVNARLAGEPEPTVATDVRGDFELRGLAPGEHEVVCIPPAGLTAVDERARVAAPSDGVVFRVRRVEPQTSEDPPPPTLAFRVRVLRPDGTAIDPSDDDVEVSYRLRPAAGTGAGTAWESGGYTVGTAEGLVGVADLAPGRSYDVRVDASGFLPTFFDDVETGSDLGVRRLQRGESLSGVVVAPDETPLEGADVWTRSVGTPAGREVEHHSWTDAAGHFVIGGLPPGPQLLTVRADAHAWHHSVETSGSSGIRVRLQRGVNLVVRARTESGAAGPQVRVHAEDAAGRRLTDSEQLGADGSATLRRLPPGDPVHLVFTRVDRANEASPDTYRPETEVAPDTGTVDVVLPW